MHAGAVDLDGGDLEGFAVLRFYGEGGDGVGAFFLGGEVEFEGLIEVVVGHAGGDELDVVDFPKVARLAHGEGGGSGFWGWFRAED